MATNLTTTTQIDGGVTLFYDKLLLARAKPHLIHDMWAQIRPMPTGHSKVIKFRQYTNLLSNTTVLSEGVTPSGKQLAKTDLTAQLYQYGDFVHITDVVEITNTSGELQEATALLSQQMAETLDEIIRNVLTTCGSKTTSTASGAVIDKANIDSLVRTMLGNSAQFITDIIGATDGVSTQAVRPAFWGTIHTDLIDDLEGVTGFISTTNYPAGGTVVDSEWGSTGNVRWCQSPNAINLVAVDDAFPAVAGTYYWLNIIGKNAYATVDLGSGNAKSIIQPFGSGDDPLRQRMTMGWKMFTTARVLNDNFMHILRVQHS